MYDVNRSPRKLSDDASTDVTIRLETISPQITCPICLNVMRRTMLVMECCHRFCSDCIQKCLRIGRKECPACRTHVPSRRSLRPDVAFDKLIEKCLLQTDVDTFVRGVRARSARISLILLSLVITRLTLKSQECHLYHSHTQMLRKCTLKCYEIL